MSPPSWQGPGPRWPSADHRHSQQWCYPVSYRIWGKKNSQSKLPRSGVVYHVAESNENICPHMLAATVDKLRAPTVAPSGGGPQGPGSLKVRILGLADHSFWPNIEREREREKEKKKQ